MNGNIEEDETIKFECSVAETGDAQISFENGVEMYVTDLPHYYNLPKGVINLDEEADGVQTVTGEMPREDYAKLCEEYKDWLSS